MKNRKTTRITEAELNQIILETTSRILTELDWRTYDSATRKAREDMIDMVKKEPRYDKLNKNKNFTKRARQFKAFQDQSTKAARDKFKDMGGDDFEFFTTIGTDNKQHPNAKGKHWQHNMETDNEGNTTMQGLNKDKRIRITPETYFNNDKDITADWHNFNREINNYNDNKSEYIPGKGWH